jgi:hypothetical protein
MSIPSTSLAFTLTSSSSSSSSKDSVLSESLDEIIMTSSLLEVILRTKEDATTRAIIRVVACRATCSAFSSLL